jgi:predicted outer membrane repeat protein
MRSISRLMVALSLWLALLLVTGCGGDQGNSVWKAICDATCARGVECFPEEGSVAQCVSECLSEIGNQPCNRNDAAIEACVEGIGELSCEDLADGRLPSPSCYNVCTGNDLCANEICDDGDDCTDNVCSPIDTSCSYPPSEDGISCADGAGSCVQGSCEAEFPCTEEGVRDAVEVVGGPHTFSCEGPTIITTEDEIIIDKDVILDGEDNLTLDGNDSHRVLRVRYVTAEVRGMTVTGGRAEEPPIGGGLWNEGALTLTECKISGNTVASGAGPEEGGGGIFNTGLLTLKNSTVSQNRATGTGNGGGIYSTESGTSGVTLIDSTVSENSTGGNGGGIFLDQGTVILVNSTVAKNQAGNMGGGIAARDDLMMTNSTVSTNSANSAGGVFADFGTVTVSNSTIVGNSSVGAAIRGGEWTVAGTLIEGDCANVRMSSGGYNLESPGDTCGFDPGGDQVDVSADDLNLGPLQDSGGPTQTHALLPGSVAIDVIPPAACLDPDGEPLTSDQRGVSRPQGDACDIGAFELEQ